MSQMTKALKKILTQQFTLKFPSLQFPRPFQGAKFHGLLQTRTLLASSTEKAHKLFDDQEQINTCSKTNLGMKGPREGLI